MLCSASKNCSRYHCYDSALENFFLHQQVLIIISLGLYELVYESMQLVLLLTSYVVHRCLPLQLIWFTGEWRLSFTRCARVICMLSHRTPLLARKFTIYDSTSLPMCGFIAQLVEHRTGIAEVTGSNPVEALIFSGFFFPIA